MSSDDTPVADFRSLGLPEPLLLALAAVGYEAPTPIQAQTIPQLLAGRDLLGQAQTGTGKTAAFALPLLARMDLTRAGPPQVLVLAPTRELALQVAEAFTQYAAHLPGLHVLPVYGGQEYGTQLRALRRGVHVVVGTPGRVMDHMRRGTLDLSALSALVLDEADEMLRMGFIDDVEWILSETPSTRQVALFSATLPPPIRAIARKHLKDPAEVTIRNATMTADTILQRCWVGPGPQKLDALTRILETETFDAMLVFVRTKIATAEISARLAARGHAVAALSGDVPQRVREQTVDALKAGRIDILVATDVAARGLDVDRITHVVNFDIPTDTEAYIHRIGRTGRAGRSGTAILFATAREAHLLRAIERLTRQPIERMDLPTAQDVNAQRIARFSQRITEALSAPDLDVYLRLVADYETANGVPAARVAAALARLFQGDEPLLMKDSPPPPPPRRDSRPSPQRGYPADAAPRTAPSRTVPPWAPPPQSRPAAHGAPERTARAPHTDASAANRQPWSQREAPGPAARPPRPDRTPPAGAGQSAWETPRRPARGPVAEGEPPRPGMARYRIEVGQSHGVEPGQIMGAIANEGGFERDHIGKILIREEHSTVDLPAGMPPPLQRLLGKVWVKGRQLRLHLEGSPIPPPAKPKYQAKTQPDSPPDRKPRPSGPAGASGTGPAKAPKKRRDRP